MMILGAVLSVAVIAGAGVITWQIRDLMRYVDARKKLAELARRPADPLPVRRLRLVPRLRRQFRPYRAGIVAGAGLLGSLLTAAAFVLFAQPSMPVADPPPVIRTVHASPTSVVPAQSTTTVTVSDQRPVAVTTVRTPLAPSIPVRTETSPLDGRAVAPTAGPSTRVDTPTSSPSSTSTGSINPQVSIPSTPSLSASIAVEP